MFLRNYWYVAAWDHEVQRQSLFSRVILNEPVVFYRTSDGVPVALEDRCCHRHMPLSDGRLEGNNIQCCYHGLVYDPTGACVEVPVVASRKGFEAIRVGSIPAPCALLTGLSAQIEMLAVEGCLKGDAELVYQAIAHDPLTAAKLSLAEARSMTKQMFRKNQKWLPHFKKINL